MRSAAYGLAGAQSAFSTGVDAADHIQNFPNPHQVHAEVVPSGIHKLGRLLHVVPVGRTESHAGEQTQPSTGVTGEGEVRNGYCFVDGFKIHL